MDTQVHAQPATPQRSTFVTVFAWISIVLGGFATFIGILQNIMIHTVFPMEEMAKAMQREEHPEQIPVVIQFMSRHLDVLVLVALVLSAVTFVSAIALLKRKNWARIVFIVLMALGIAYNIGGLFLQFDMFKSMSQSVGPAPPPEFETVMRIMTIAFVAMALGFSAVCAWIIKKLMSARIRAEFV